MNLSELTKKYESWKLKRKIQKAEKELIKSKEDLKSFYVNITDIWKNLSFEERKVLAFFISNYYNDNRKISRTEIHDRFEKETGLSQKPLDKYLIKLTRIRLSLPGSLNEFYANVLRSDFENLNINEKKLEISTRNPESHRRKKLKTIKEKGYALTEGKIVMSKAPLLVKTAEGKEHFYNIFLPVYFNDPQKFYKSNIKRTLSRYM